MQNYIDLAGALYKLPEGWSECMVLGNTKPHVYNRAMGRMCELQQIGDKVYIAAEELIELIEKTEIIKEEGKNVNQKI